MGNRPGDVYGGDHGPRNAEEKAQKRGGLKLNVEELVVEDGLQARGSVKVIRLEVDSTSEMESEDSKRSDRLKSEA
jgi:hypothetical protein